MYCARVAVRHGYGRVTKMSESTEVTLVPQAQGMQVSDRVTDLASAKQVAAMLSQLKAMMAQGLLKEGEHYGRIPGTGDSSPKTLYKSGAEFIALVFGFSAQQVDHKFEERLDSDGVPIFISTVTVAINDRHGNTIAQRVAVCGTDEEKYMWEACWSKTEFDNLPPHLKRVVYKSYRGKESTQNQKRQHATKHRNTIMQMAYKRGFVQAVIQSAAATSLFKSDIDEWDQDRQLDAVDPERHQDPPAVEQAKTAEIGNNPERAKLIEQLRKAAHDKGTNGLLEVWKGFSNDARKLVGGEFKEMKDIATETDAKSSAK